jgi:glutamate-1-semialdehyde 2,1-aminomutase
MAMKTVKSKKLMEEAVKVLPGGVNSPVRAFRAVGGEARFVAKAKGSKIFDADGQQYVE